MFFAGDDYNYIAFIIKMHPKAIYEDDTLIGFVMYKIAKGLYTSLGLTEQSTRINSIMKEVFECWK